MIKRFLYILLQSVTSVVLPLTMMPLVISSNGISSFGKFSYHLVAFQILTILVDFGIATTGIKQLIQGYSIQTLIKTKLLIYFLTLPISIALFSNHAETIFGLFLLPLSTSLNIQFYFNSTKKEKNYSILSTLIRVFGFLIFILNGEYTLLNYSLLLGLLELSITLFSYAYVNFSIYSDNIRSIKEVLYSNIGYLVNNISSLPYTSYPIAFLRLYSNSIEAGTYAAIYRISSGISNLSAPFNLILLAQNEINSSNIKNQFLRLMLDLRVRIFMSLLFLGTILLAFSANFTLKTLNLESNTTNKVTFYVLLSIPTIVSISRIISVNVLIPFQKQNIAGLATIIPGIIATISFSGLFQFDILEVSFIALFSELLCTVILVFFIFKKI